MTWDRTKRQGNGRDTFEAKHKAASHGSFHHYASHGDGGMVCGGGRPSVSPARQTLATFTVFLPL
ncbi:hypothetical protein N658DRAFT_494466 [Parathielavia hyrcaniae]|uniref:Uncharacterized protein n=1 Tax=Parathielavia hyrcaniae TaxID=113614 RepID=A0AAN6Q918_9PEZI|nr:hypothetical protein N658DRAFT_494466 [Parathielavia hyrcaniae]